MARGKKKETILTPEEKLQQALVSESEWPYKVPENWRWVTASSIASVISKGTTPQGGKDGYTDDGVKFLRVENICNDGTISHEGIMHVSEEMHTGFLKRSVLQEGDILVSIAGTLGKTAVVRSIDLPMNTNQAVSFIRLKDNTINSAFFKLAIDNPIIQERLLSQTKVTSIPNLTLDIIGRCPIPLSPLSEQQRIVDRIESLFVKLDEAKEKAQAVVDGFENRKAAILHKAFTGELTERWRRTNNVDNDSWRLYRFDDCVDVMQNGIAKRKGNSGKYYVVLRLANLTDNGFNESDLREILLDEKEQKNYELKPNDVLMVRVNGSKDNVGKQYLITNQKRWAFCDHIIRIRYSNFIIPQYMVLFSKSEVYRQYIKDNMVSSAGQNTISRKGMAKLNIPIPLLGEQEQIVANLSRIFEKEQQVKDSAEQVIAQIDTMKKSILARAFRGELGTNDPSDESAEELLKRIL